jgi:hypothetical protein
MDLRDYSGGTGAFRTSDGKVYESSSEAYNHQTDVDFAAQHPEAARAEAAFVGEQAGFLYQVGLLIGAILIFVFAIPLLVIVVPCIIIADYGFFILSLFPLIILKQAFDDTQQIKTAFPIQNDLNAIVHWAAAIGVNLLMYAYSFSFLRPISKIVKQMFGALSAPLRRVVITGMVALSVAGLALSTLDRAGRLVQAQVETLSVPVAQDGEGIALYSAPPLFGIHRGKVLENLSGGELEVQGVNYIPLYGTAANVLGNVYWGLTRPDTHDAIVKSITQLRQFKVVTADGTTGYVDVAAFPYDTWRSGNSGFELFFSQIWIVQFFKTHNITSMFSRQIFPALMPSLIPLLIYLGVLIAGLIVLWLGFKKLNAMLQLKAFYAAQQGAERGDIAALAAMGDYYYWGNYIEQDREKAFDLYAKAAEQGNTTAQSRLGDVYDIGGYGVEQDKEKAVEWWTKSASHKGASAYTLAQLGNCYQNGIGVPVDDRKAVEYFTGAARKGNIDAMRRLGAYYYEGRGIKKNWGKSAEWFNKAARKGDTFALYMMGLFYAEGIGVRGRKKSRILKAKAYLRQAGGIEEAVVLLNDLEYERYETQVSFIDKLCNRSHIRNEHGIVWTAMTSLIKLFAAIFVAYGLWGILALKLLEGSPLIFIAPLVVFFLATVSFWYAFTGDNKIWNGVWGIVCLGIFLFLLYDFTSVAKQGLMNSNFQKAGIEKTARMGFGATATADALNVREGPSADTALVTQLKKGDPLTVTEDTGADWVKVEAEGKTGYVNRDYISIDGAEE